MRKIVLLVTVAAALSLAGCITGAGQYRGVMSGVELKINTQDGREVQANVSGGATVEIDKNGAIKATSAGSDVQEIVKGVIR